MSDPPFIETTASPDSSPLQETEQEVTPAQQPSFDEIPDNFFTTRWYYRHFFPVRLSHWVNVVCVVILIMSGFQIFNAHPALYWGNRSDRDRPFLAVTSVKTEGGDRKGITIVGGHVFDTTGVLGFSEERARGFPGWATLPSAQWLAMGRRWHLFFAWIL